MKRGLALIALLFAGATMVALQPHRESPGTSVDPLDRFRDSAAWQPWQARPPEAVSDSSQARPGSRAVTLAASGDPPRVGADMTIPLDDSTVFRGSIRRVLEHPNGDITLVARADDTESAVVTLGAASVYGRIHATGRTFQVQTDASGSWLTDLSDPRLEVDPLGDDAIVAAAADRARDHTPAWVPPASVQGHTGAEDALIDVMFLYTDELTDRYPGEMIETRINHLVAIANQALVDSRVRAQVRLVGLEQTGYSRSQDNRSALDDLRAALAGELIPGLPGLLGRRLQYGADIVVLTWPHDIETRGACGIAYYPQIEDNGDPRREFGVQVTNDGQSNWSICSDAVFTHELGHNLGAQHQRETIQSPDPDARNFAWTRPGRWHTLMGSFGTGHVDRYRRLDVFSNPAIQCGGEPCGSTQNGDRADNAGQMRSLAPTVAGYFGSQGSTDVHPDRSNADQDGDGVIDRDDPYPFDPDDGSGPENPADPLAFSEREVASAVAPGDWELLIVSSGNDRVLSIGLDGRFRGTVAAPEAVNRGPVLTGYSDLVADGSGRLYLLASEDVRRFDRLSGRLIDVFLDSALPGPRTLQSAFPRALGWVDADRLAVLGDSAIELYDRSGRHLNPVGGSEPSEEPGSWSQSIALPLRALAATEDRLFVAEAGLDRIMTFSKGQGERGNDLDHPSVTDPRDLVIGPDGLLYLANGSGNNILRFDPETDAFVDVFIPAGRGGLDVARALAFGPEGRLFVVSRSNNAILVFDGSDGRFVEILADARSAPLDAPENLIIEPVVDEIGPGHSGHYYVPSRSGEGWLLEILDEERAAISWFTYPPASTDGEEQAWIVGVGEIDGRHIVFDDMLATRLSDANGPIAADNITQRPWGRLEMEFGHCGFGQARYDTSLFEDSGSLDFVRLITIDGLPCGSAPRSPRDDAPGISGQWNDPDSSGQGWFLQEVGDGRVFTAWFTYDAHGNQAWVVGEGRLEGRTLVFDSLVLTEGARFGSDFDPEAVERRDWGRLEFQFDDCNNARVEYQSILPDFGSGELDPQRLTGLDQLDCGLPNPGAQ